MEKYKSEIAGHLDIFVAVYDEVFDSEIEKRQNILIHGDKEGLRSFARLVTKLADLDQDDIKNLPIGAREHNTLYVRRN